ncbi:hypothetical protein [Streptomyces sp. NPDC006510]|uniref:hypothetical protein n=1 Tax=Streptomyces sp. NPDC006510 TaxID=3155600 RepID=UPI0033BF65B1
MRDRFTTDFQHTLFDRPDVRKRWVLRHRNKESVTQIAGELAWSVGASLDQIVPAEHLGRTVRAAVLYDFAESVEMFTDDEDSGDSEAPAKWWHLNLTPSVAKTLDWYIRCFPGEAYTIIGDIQRHARTTGADYSKEVSGVLAYFLALLRSGEDSPTGEAARCRRDASPAQVRVDQVERGLSLVRRPAARARGLNTTEIGSRSSAPRAARAALGAPRAWRAVPKACRTLRPASVAVPPASRNPRVRDWTCCRPSGPVMYRSSLS